MGNQYLRRTIKLVSWTVLIMLLSQSSGFAASCFHEYLLNQFDDPLAIVLKKTDSVFIGEAIDKSKVILESKGKDPIITEERTRFDVAEVVIGKQADTLVVTSISEECSCKFSFEVGKKYIVFVSKRHRDNSQDTDMLMYFCGYVREIGTPEADKLIEFVKKRKNKSPPA